ASSCKTCQARTRSIIRWNSPIAGGLQRHRAQTVGQLADLYLFRLRLSDGQRVPMADPEGRQFRVAPHTQEYAGVILDLDAGGQSAARIHRSDMDQSDGPRLRHLSRRGVDADRRRSGEGVTVHDQGGEYADTAVADAGWYGQASPL